MVCFSFSYISHITQPTPQKLSAKPICLSFPSAPRTSRRSRRKPTRLLAAERPALVPFALLRAAHVRGPAQPRLVPRPQYLGAAIHIYTHTHTHTYIYIYLSTHIYIYMYVYLVICMYMCMCMYIYIYIYICVCVCIHACMRMYKHTLVYLHNVGIYPLRLTLSACNHQRIGHRVVFFSFSKARALLSVCGRCAPPSSVLKCVREVFVWGFGVLFLSCMCECRC